ncbi:Tetratricopeptide repeat-containing protein [Polaromonas sp. OV174]|uniref:tetratricopeptide repeat protein n=1 Tax=Polaromonas sp. OV174 TaxID=1855300 RepID=UPI0008ED1977|nr:tetratricopeptide repeat protein [Polaromonas sp. OV174]SFC17362.1 Tetratricopeptide repeat-containing protein [Polaromonas sp. OV174]
MTFKAYPRSLGKWLAAGTGLGMCLALTGWPAQAQTQTSSPPAESAPIQPAARRSPSPAACPVQPTYPLPADPASLQARQDQLDAIAPACLHSADFYAWRGALLLAQHQPEAAVEALERALLLEPNLPGAQLDYADALLGMGDTVSAKDLLEQLAARPDLPAHLRPLLARELAAASPDAWRTRWVLTTALGLDSNLNNAPAASELTLTFPQGPVTLSLLESSRPQGGTAALNTVQWQALKPQGGQLWLLQAELRARQTAEAATRYQQADVALNWLQAPEAPRQWLVRAGLTHVDFGGQVLLQSVRASVLRQWQAPQPTFMSASCRPSVGMELEARRYPVSPELNGRYGGLVGAIHCSADYGPQGSLLSQQQLSVQLRLGGDQADNSLRPGGNYRRAEFRATWDGRTGLYKLSADYGYTHQADSAGYSPLLGGNLNRQAGRHSLRVEIARPLAPQALSGVDGFVSVELNRQASNLAAFESRQNAVFAGLRWSLP